eukprot:4322467-Lingulodinium_polyedra.AAC.1
MPMCAGAATRVPADVHRQLVRPSAGSEVSAAGEAATCHPRATMPWVAASKRPPRRRCSCASTT